MPKESCIARLDIGVEVSEIAPLPVTMSSYSLQHTFVFISPPIDTGLGSIALRYVYFTFCTMLGLSSALHYAWSALYVDFRALWLAAAV